MKSRKKVLICGASGFIGRNLFETLSERDDMEVVGTCHTRAPFAPDKIMRVDLRDNAAVMEATRGVDILIQAAATTSGAKEICTKPHYHVTDNAVMNSLIFRAAFENRVSHVVFFSCTIMYPNSDTPLKETDLNLNEDVHEKYFGPAWTKLYTEKICEYYSRLGRTKFTVIRHSNIYGPYDKYDLERSHVFGATVTKVLRAKDGKVLVWGEGKEERDVLYVSDLVRFVEMAVEKQHQAYDIYNVGTGKTIAVADLVRKVIELSGRQLDIQYDHTKPTIVTKVVLDIEKAKQKLGWVPQVSLEEGITKTLDWYRKNVTS